MTFKFTFLDSGREPQCAPDPRYPNGIDLDFSGVGSGCCYNAPYPAPRCGVMQVECETCGIRIAVTVAGRVDDPRSVRLACRRN